MRLCRRRRLSYVVLVVTCALFVGMACFGVYDVLFRNGGATGSVGQELAGAVLLGCTALYLVIFTLRKHKNYISYDDHAAVFHFGQVEERRVSWAQMRPPEVILKWMDTDMVSKKILRFAFADGRTLDISHLAFSGYQDLYETMRKQGVLERYGITSHFDDKDAAIAMAQKMFSNGTDGMFASHDDPACKRRVFGPFTFVKRVKPKDD